MNMHDLNLYTKTIVSALTHSLRNMSKTKTIVRARRLRPMDVRVGVSKHQNKSHMRDNGLIMKRRVEGRYQQTECGKKRLAQSSESV